MPNGSLLKKRKKTLKTVQAVSNSCGPVHLYGKGSEIRKSISSRLLSPKSFDVKVHIILIVISYCFVLFSKCSSHLASAIFHSVFDSESPIEFAIGDGTVIVSSARKRTISAVYHTRDMVKLDLLDVLFLRAVFCQRGMVCGRREGGGVFKLTRIPESVPKYCPLP